jgi:hypothetical protein
VTLEILAFSSGVGRHSDRRNSKPAKSLLQRGFINSLPTSVFKDLSSTVDSNHTSRAKNQIPST